MSTKSVFCTDSTSNDNSRVIKFTKSASGVVTSVNSISNVSLLSSINNNTIIPIHTSANSNTKIVSENKTRHIFSSSNRVKLLEFLNKNYSNATSKIHLTKPPSCICKYCTISTSLPIKQSAAYNLLFKSSSKIVHSDMYSSNLPVTDCISCATNDCHCTSKSNTTYITQINSDSPKTIWINELVSLINKKEYTSEKSLANYKNNSKQLSSLPNIQNKVPKVTKNAKSYTLLCNKCKRSRLGSYANSCKCSMLLRRVNRYNHKK